VSATPQESEQAHKQHIAVLQVDVDSTEPCLPEYTLRGIHNPLDTARCAMCTQEVVVSATECAEGLSACTISEPAHTHALVVSPPADYR
jgi:hypothetical protein